MYFTVLVYCVKKNLATQCSSAPTPTRLDYFISFWRQKMMNKKQSKSNAINAVIYVAQIHGRYVRMSSSNMSKVKMLKVKRSKVKMSKVKILKVESQKSKCQESICRKSKCQKSKCWKWESWKMLKVLNSSDPSWQHSAGEGAHRRCW
jgi:hypothetical protein